MLSDESINVGHALGVSDKKLNSPAAEHVIPEGLLSSFRALHQVRKRKMLLVAPEAHLPHHLRLNLC
jgi:hypothetical protein